MYPEQIDPNFMGRSKVRISMMSAGMKSTTVLLENGKIFWWGTNNSINNLVYPVECEYWKNFTKYSQRKAYE